MNKKLRDANPQVREFDPHRCRQIRSDEFDGVPSEAFAELSFEARLALLILRTCSDKNGVFPFHPKTLKLRVFPHDNLDFAVIFRRAFEPW